ncbi:MAG: hypothetical protein JWN02_1549 [Acidobacteria bacterium]|nr:hypothetical protein [Acidobacteriota bacterium]
MKSPGTERIPSGRPVAGEFADYAQGDIDYVAGDDAVLVLEQQREAVLALLATMDDERVAGLTYAPGKWTLKEVIGHLCDDERIFAYRLLCVARGDLRPLPGFDEQEYMRDAGFEARTLEELAAEYASVRAATLSLLGSMTPGGWLRRGVVNGYEASVRGLAFHIAGHELHHLRTVRERYLR